MIIFRISTMFFVTVAKQVAHRLVVGYVMGSILVQHCVIAKDVKSFTYRCYIRCATLIALIRGMHWPKTGATLYHLQLRVPHKGRTIKALVVCNGFIQVLWTCWYNGKSLGCYPLSWGMFQICPSVYTRKDILYLLFYKDNLAFISIFDKTTRCDLTHLLVHT